jgi:diguanylate cyclase (GGDEF)-like protein
MSGSEAADTPDIGAGRRPHPVGLGALVGTLAVAALLLWIPLGRVPVPGSDLWPALGLLAAFSAAEGREIRVEFRRQTFGLTGTDAVLVVGLFFVAPLALLAARVGGGALVLLIRRASPEKLAFNLALFATETGLAVTLFRALAPSNLDSPAAWLPAYAAVLPAQLLGSVAVLAAIFLTDARVRREDLLALIPVVFVGAPFEVTLGLVAVELLAHEPWTMLLVLALAALLYYAFGAYSALAQRHTTLNEVHAFTRGVVAAQSGHDVLTLLLREACRMTHAAGATVRLAESRPPGWPASLTLDADRPRPDGSGRYGAISESDAGSEPGDDELLRRVLAGESRVLPRGTPVPAVRTWLASRGVRDAVLVPLTGTRDVVGTLEIVDRLGEESSFTEDDRRLAETLAAPVAVAFENSRLIDRSTYDATHDTLTGLPNRALFLARVHEALEGAGTGAARRSLAVLDFDLDRFKEINETLGHESGDGVLRRVALRLREAVPPGATLARTGGDEFAVLLPDLGADADALGRADAVRAAMQVPLDLEEMTLEVAASYGLAFGPDTGLDASGLLRRAAIAMQAAKGDPGSVQVWQSVLDTASPRRLALVGQLRRALDHDELRVFYQPKVVLGDGAVVGVEALVRWQHPELGMLSPDDFVPLAEQTGLVRPLTAVVLRVALRQCRQWLDAGRHMSVAVNLSARGLDDATLPGLVGELLAAAGVPPSALTLEITERSVMSEVARTLPLLQRLADLGVALSVDDFGTGYSSLAYLRRLPVTEVKIDKSFVQDMGTDAGDAAIVETIVGLARHLGLRVVAEGVEDELSRERLVDMGCDLAQGYLISRPLPADRLDDWLARMKAVALP